MTCLPEDLPGRLLEVGCSADVPPGQSKKFYFDSGGREIEAFVVNYEGTFHAYLNRCCHVPMTMDWVENQFFTEDGRYVQCATHGAWYEPASGLCVAGPPLGKCLTRVAVVVRDGKIFAACPDE